MASVTQVPEKTEQASSPDHGGQKKDGAAATNPSTAEDSSAATATGSSEAATGTTATRKSKRSNQSASTLTKPVKDKDASSSSAAPNSGHAAQQQSMPAANGTPNAAAGQTSKKTKRSLWQGFKSFLLPCIPGLDGGKAHDLDDVTGPSSKTAGTGGKEVPPVNEKKVDEKAPATPPKTDISTATTKAGETAPVPPAQTKPTPTALTVPASPVESDGDMTVVVPPSPHAHLLPREETEGVTSGAVQAPGGTGAGESHHLHPGAHHPHSHTHTGSGTITTGSDVSITDENEGDVADNEGGAQGMAADLEVEDEDDEEERLILQGGTGIPIGPDGKPCPLLPPVAPAHKGRKCLVLDLDETLLHSSFKLIPQADYVVPVEIEWQWHNVYVIKRPGVDNFLKQMGELYEVVIFTASLSKYADPVLDKLDVHKVVAHRLFRESCYNHKGSYVKDLSRLGRPVEDMIILDNSPASYIFHPNNAVPVSSWFNDPHDTELTDLCPFLADLMHVEDVRGVLDGGL